MDTLKQINCEVAACKDCILSDTRTNTVPGEGPENADIMIIGEAPGFNEDKEGRPFIGAAGRLLSELLANAGFTRGDVYITNTVKCRPPDNRNPLPFEMDQCKKYLERQVELINPEIIITLGRFSFNRFFPDETIGASRGKLMTQGDQKFYPMYHPAAALRQDRFKKLLEEDMMNLRSLLKDISISTASTSSKEESMNGGEQLSMF